MKKYHPKWWFNGLCFFPSTPKKSAPKTSKAHLVYGSTFSELPIENLNQKVWQVEGSWAPVAWNPSYFLVVFNVFDTICVKSCIYYIYIYMLSSWCCFRNNKSKQCYSLLVGWDIIPNKIICLETIWVKVHMDTENSCSVYWAWKGTMTEVKRPL